MLLLLSRKMGLGFIFAILVFPFWGQAQVVNSWTGSSGGNWFDNGNWSQGHYPVAGESIRVTGGVGNVLLTNSTPWLAELVISNKTITCSNWSTAVKATNVYLRNLAVITLPSAFTTNQMSNRVWIVCSNIEVAKGSSISLNGKGYAGDNGPGRGTGGWHCSGGGHGGKGGWPNNQLTRYPGPCDSESEPVQP